MQITLSSLKIARSLSEETLAFTATLLIDGKPAYAVSNHGQGGCNAYHALYREAPSIAEIEADLVASGLVKADAFEKLDWHISDLIGKEEAKKALKRTLKKITVIDMHKGQEALFTFKAEPTAANIERLLAAKPELKGKIVNGNPALEAKALELI